MAKKIFKRAVSEDFDIVEDSKVVGSIRLKPSGILWKAKGKHSWKGVSVEQFADFADASGKDQMK